MTNRGSILLVVTSLTRCRRSIQSPRARRKDGGSHSFYTCKIVQCIAKVLVGGLGCRICFGGVIGPKVLEASLQVRSYHSAI